MRYLKVQNSSLRHALSAFIAIFIAGLLSPYAFTQSYWLLLATFLMTQVTRGTPLRQSIIYYLMMLCVVFISAFITVSVIVIGLFLICNYLMFVYRAQAQHKFALHLLYLFAITLLASQLNNFSHGLIISQASSLNINDTLSHRILDISVGAAIGIVCGFIILPIQYDLLFKRDVLKIMQKLTAYAEVFTHHLFSGSSQAIHTFVDYPSWVYEVGFNPGLRSGYRFFLIHVERIQEILIAMNEGNRFIIKDEILSELKPAALTAMQKNIELMQILKQYLADKSVQIQGDYTSDIVTLENTLSKVIPTQLELLDIAEEYVALTDFVYAVKALRKILLKLIMSFPNNNIQRGA